MNRHYEKFDDGTVKCIEDEIPFEIPENWAWCRLESLMQKVSAGSTPRGGKNVYVENGVKFIRSQNVYNNGLVLSNIAYITSEIHKEKSNSHVIANDLLLNITGASIGRCALVPGDFDIANINQHVLILRLIDYSIKEFIHLAITSPLVFNQIMDMQVGGTKEGLSAEKANKLFIPIPPLNEQSKIIDKIHTLIPQINIYSNLENDSKRLDEELQNQLKKSILQYAIQGKLVPQDTNDEPAIELLKRIREEKEYLIKEKKIKRDKVDSVIFKGDDNKYYERINGNTFCIDAEIPFEIPDNWLWARMGNIGDWGAGSTPTRGREDYYKGNILWLKTGELNNSIVYDTEETVSEKALKECSLRRNKVGDVLIAMYGATIGKLAIAGTEMTTNQACCGCTPFTGVYNKYLFYFLMASKDEFIKKGEGGAQPNISREKLIKHLIPMPPMEEQRQIVRAIESLIGKFHILLL